MTSMICCMLQLVEVIAVGSLGGTTKFICPSWAMLCPDPFAIPEALRGPMPRLVDRHQLFCAGVSVMADMFSTTHFMVLIMLTVWRTPLWVPILFYAVFAPIEGAYLSSVLLKVPTGLASHPRIKTSGCCKWTFIEIPGGEVQHSPSALCRKRYVPLIAVTAATQTYHIQLQLS